MTAVAVVSNCKQNNSTTIQITLRLRGLYSNLRSSSPTNHLQYLGLGILLKDTTCVMQCGLDDYQMGREIDLRKEERRGKNVSGM